MIARAARTNDVTPSDLDHQPAEMEYTRAAGRRADPRGGRREVDASRLPRSPLSDLSSRQREVLDIVADYYRATREPCPSTLVGRKLGLHHSTVHDHFMVLHRKGWLRAPNTPAVPTRW